MTLLPPRSGHHIPLTWSPTTLEGGNGQLPLGGGDLPNVTKLAGGSISLWALSPHMPDSQPWATSCHICFPSRPQRGALTGSGTPVGPVT